MNITVALAKEFGISQDRIERTIELIDEGNTIPFIARYRKEVTGSLDDTVLRKLAERLDYLRSLEKRREEVRAAIADQGKLTAEIEAQLDKAEILAEIEDIYRPFRPKRKTRASVARERGLEDLALALIMQEKAYEPSLLELAERFVDPEKGISSIDEAFGGARDIIAEDISDNAEYRKEIRALTFELGFITSKQCGEDPDGTYGMYYEYLERLAEIPGHRVLGLNRAESRGVVRVSIKVDTDIILNYLFSKIITEPDSPAYPHVAAATIDSYERLIAPSIERELRAQLTERASENAIKLFSENLRHLLMAAPVKGKIVMGIDPGYRTGCKLAVVDKTGKVLETTVIYPTKPFERIDEAKRIVKQLIRRYGVDIIAIGNGTASRESEIFIAGVLREIPELVNTVVSEAGASVYSASPLAAEEFPDFDVTERSAVSIARRLQDPLAELVKIDPKSIGVGQYQHDMKETQLDQALAGVVEDCVNAVGVDVNTASYSLLSHVAGINSAVAKNIVKYREEHGEFSSRDELLHVPRIGPKAFEQCAGFLRVPGSGEVLDMTGVHPESYRPAKELLRRFGYSDEDVREHRLGELREKAERYGMERLAESLGVGVPTLLDIIAELEKPGRDVRDSLPQPVLRDDIMELADLAVGMTLTGTVRNVTDFGAFVDIGVHQDGLVHVSQITNRYIKHPSEVLAVGDIVTVKVLSVDVDKKRIGLTMKL
ncbi:MAG: Tex family protein [Eubacteriales bacterium]|jgi:uncharacterized protein|nr:RNA-binding transcriptional accessory protein [Clostridiales bacterium]